MLTTLTQRNQRIREVIKACKPNQEKLMKVNPADFTCEIDQIK